ncbi:MAG: hypothetical protein WDO72_14740 [Pseudomonadota bacterium]
MSRVELKTLWTDDDGMLQILVGATNGCASASMEVYSYPDDVESFATRLEAFPSSPEDQVSWESGGPDPKCYGHMLLRAHVLDGSGHSVVEVLMDIRGEPPNRATSNFFLCCNPADLNELGRRINAWLPSSSEQLSVEWRDA